MEASPNFAQLAFGVFGPMLAPNYTFQFAVLWVMVLFALTWDVMGGQMGYNSLGNIFFFGAGMYVSALVQIGLYYDIAKYTAAGAPLVAWGAGRGASPPARPLFRDRHAGSGAGRRRAGRLDPVSRRRRRDFHAGLSG